MAASPRKQAQYRPAVKDGASRCADSAWRRAVDVQKFRRRRRRSKPRPPESDDDKTLMVVIGCGCGGGRARDGFGTGREIPGDGRRTGKGPVHVCPGLSDALG